MTLPDSWLPKDLIRPVVRYRYRVIAFFLFAVGLAAAGTTLCPKKYKSESKLFVRVGRENATLDPTVTTGETITLNGSRESEINSIVEQLGSRYVFEKALARLDPAASDETPESREMALQRLRSSVAISSPRHSTVLTVTCKGESPLQAQKAVAALVDVYLDEHMRINRTSGSYEFFAEQTELLKSQLEEAQASLCDAKNNLCFSSLEDRSRAIEAQVSGVETQMRQAGAALSASRAKLAALANQLRQLPQPLVSQLVGGSPNDGLAGMREQLFTLRAHERELLSKYTANHPLAVAIRDQVRDVEAALNNEEPGHDQTMAAILAQEMANRDSLAAQEKALAAQLSDLRTRIVEFNQHEATFSSLTRQVRQLESRYLAYQANSEQARMDRALQADRITNVSIIQPASFEPAPVSPKKALILALAVLLGGCGGIAVAFLSDHLHPPRSSVDATDWRFRLFMLGQMPLERPEQVTAR